MQKNSEQILIDKKGKPIAIQIPVREYKKMLAALEEMEDVKSYKKAKKAKSKWIPFEEAFAIIETQNLKSRV